MACARCGKSDKPMAGPRLCQECDPTYRKAQGKGPPPPRVTASTAPSFDEEEAPPPPKKVTVPRRPAPAPTGGPVPEDHRIRRIIEDQHGLMVKGHSEYGANPALLALAMDDLRVVIHALLVLYRVDPEDAERAARSMGRALGLIDAFRGMRS